MKRTLFCLLVIAFLNTQAPAESCSTPGVPDYISNPIPAPPAVLTVPETGEGIIHFVIQNTTSCDELLVGEDPIQIFLGGDRTDDFFANPFGIVIPALIPANGVLVVPVQIIPDGGKDLPIDFGLWSLALGVRIEFDLPGLPLADGLDNSAAIQIDDVPEPNSAVLLTTGMLTLIGVVRRRLCS